MAVAKKNPSATIPANMMDTLSSLRTAATTPINREEFAVAARIMPPAEAAQVPPPLHDAVNRSTEPAAAEQAPQDFDTEYKKEMSYTEEKTAQALEGRELKVNETIKTMISLRLLKSDKEKFQEFFRAHGLSFTDGLYMAADFIVKEVDNGRLSMSKSGIQYRK